MVDRAHPNAAHLAIADVERIAPADARVTVLTQNIDGLHQRAGSTNVVELHGSLFRTRCTRCDAPPFEDRVAHPEAPSCARCGAAQRPDVVLFGEALDADDEWAAKKALRECDLFIAVGTSGTVSPASNFVRSAAYEGARTILVNLEPMTIPNPAFAEEILGRAEDVLPALLQRQPS
jgi:NAD-dependent deacetylase